MHRLNTLSDWKGSDDVILGEKCFDSLFLASALRIHSTRLSSLTLCTFNSGARTFLSFIAIDSGVYAADIAG